MRYDVFKDQTIDGTTTTATSEVIPVDLARTWHPNGDVTAAIKCASTGGLRDIDISYRLVGKLSGNGGWYTLIDDLSAQSDILGVSCDDDNMHAIDIAIPWIEGIQFKVDRGSGGDADCIVNIDLYIN